MSNRFKRQLRKDLRRATKHLYKPKTTEVVTTFSGGSYRKEFDPTSREFDRSLTIPTLEKELKASTDPKPKNADNGNHYSHGNCNSDRDKLEDNVRMDNARKAYFYTTHIPTPPRRETYGERCKRVAAAWDACKMTMRDLYIKSLKNGTPQPQIMFFGDDACPNGTCTNMQCTTMRLYFLHAHKRQDVHFCACRSLIETLMANHFFPATCQFPKTAFHFGAMDHIHQMKEIGKMSMTQWVALSNQCNRYKAGWRYRGPKLNKDMLASTLVIYARIKLLVEESLREKEGELGYGLSSS